MFKTETFSDWQRKLRHDIKHLFHSVIVKSLTDSSSVPGSGALSLRPAPVQMKEKIGKCKYQNQVKSIFYMELFIHSGNLRFFKST